jgi:methylenetetrahydrofolate reductase (NADPH)
MSHSAQDFSFELFPPRTPEGVAKLPQVVAELATVQPSYFSVTFGAGGSDQSGTYDTVMHVLERTGCEVAPHLTCIGASHTGIRALLQRYHEAGVRRLVALRGDLPATAATADAPGEFHFATDLVRFIRQEHGSHFRIEVAAYPEMHPQGVDAEQDFARFCAKVEAGADAAITQYFYNADAYFDFVERCRRARLTIPIIPGIMPITNYAQLLRFSTACGAEVPRWIRLRLETLQHDKAALLDFGVETAARLCQTLLAGGAPGLHFYSLNQPGPTLRLWRHLGLPMPAPAAA